MTELDQKIIYRAFVISDAGQRIQISDLINDSGMHCSGDLPDIGSIALIGSTIIGFMGGHIKYASTGNIDMFVVDCKHRRQGIGLALGQHLISELRYRGCTQFTAIVEPTAASAIALYRSLGAEFKVIYEFESDIETILGNIKTRLEALSTEENSPVT